MIMRAHDDMCYLKGFGGGLFKFINLKVPCAKERVLESKEIKYKIYMASFNYSFKNRNRYS